ncbi:MAG: hypothetical protein KDB61_14160 [Planctomycetes bacterium]|nr:hypothetical protein [Planctomycetota bacterium]
MDTNSILKYTFLILGAPVWVPFVKALLMEFRLAMREEGGFWGYTLTPKERQRILDQLSKEPLRQVHIPKGHLGIRRRSAPLDPAQPGPQTGGRRGRGFGKS